MYVAVCVIRVCGCSTCSPVSPQLSDPSRLAVRLMWQLDAKGSVDRNREPRNPGPARREGEGLTQGVEHREELKSHWSSKRISSFGVGPPSSVSV